MVVGVTAMQADQIKNVVEVHLQSFPNFFLTFLGRNFLSELYRGLLDDPSGIALVTMADDRLAGFVVGTTQPAGFYGRLLKKRWWRFALAACGPLAKRPGSLPRLLRAARLPQQVTRAEDRGTLMSIAVLPGMQGRGIGQILVRSFLAEAKRRGLARVDLTTDKNNNAAVNVFYQRLGFALNRSYITPEGREMNEYMIAL